MRLIAALLSTIVTLAGCDSALVRPPPPPLGVQLTGEQVKAAFSGNSLTRNEEEVPPLVVYFGEDGELRGLRSNKFTDTGTWRIDDDRVCGDWENWFGTLSNCWNVYQAGETFTLKHSDRPDVLRGTLISGNVAIRK